MARSKLEIIIEAQNQAKRELDNLSNQLKQVSDDQQQFADNSENARQSFLGFTSSISVGILAADAIRGALRGASRALGGFISSSIDTALSVERISATLPILAKNTGKTTKEINSIIKAIRDENKSIREATEVTRGIVLAGLDEADALRLITVARDVGATVGRSSADVNRLVLESFQTLNPGILKQVGLNISLRETYRNLSNQTGKNVAEFTTLERQQALLNAIFGEGAKFAGAYDAAMGTVQKVTNSVKDASEDIKFVLGSLLTQGFFPIVTEALNMVRAFREWAITSENVLRPELVALSEKIGSVVLGIFNAFIATVKTLTQVFMDMFNFLKDTGIIDNFNKILDATGKIIKDTVIPVIKFLFGDIDTLKIILAATFAVIAVALVAVLAPLVLSVTTIILVVTGLIVFIRALKKVLTEVFLFFIILQDNLVKSFNNIKNSFVTNFGIIRDMFFEGLGVIRDFFENIWEDIKNIVFGQLDAILSKVMSVINAITSIPSQIGGGISAVGGAVGGLIGLQEGGIVRRPTIARIGEAGPEAVVPLSRLGGLGGGANIIINFNGSVFGEDADRVGKDVGDAIINRLGLNMRIG